MARWPGFSAGSIACSARSTNKYVHWSEGLIHRSGFSLVLLAGVAALALLIGSKLPSSFLPEEDQGYVYVNVQLPNAASLPRTSEYCKRVEEILAKTPGVKYYTTVLGFSLLSQAQTTYNALFFVTLQPWDERKKASEQLGAIRAHINKELAAMPEAKAFSFPPPSIPGVGTAGGFTFILEDRAGQDPSFLTANLDAYHGRGRQKDRRFPA